MNRSFHGQIFTPSKEKEQIDNEQFINAHMLLTTNFSSKFVPPFFKFKLTSSGDILRCNFLQLHCYEAKTHILCDDQRQYEPTKLWYIRQRYIYTPPGPANAILPPKCAWGCQYFLKPLPSVLRSFSLADSFREMN